jgi:hypothetical protein
VWSNDAENSSGGSGDTDEVFFAGQIKGDNPGNKGVFQVGCWGFRLKNSSP